MLHIPNFMHYKFLFQIMFSLLFLLCNFLEGSSEVRAYLS